VTLNSTLPATQAAVRAEFSEELALSLLSLAFFRCVARGAMPIRMRRGLTDLRLLYLFSAYSFFPGLPYPSGKHPSPGMTSRQLASLGCA
jgi:hypothetical protein